MHIGDATECKRERRRIRGAGRGRAGVAHPRRGPVPDDARHLGDERRHRDRRGGCGHRRHGYPDGDHPLHAGDGDADDHRREGRRPDRPQAGVRHRQRDLRHGLVRHGDLAVAAGPAGGLVVSRRRRCGADPPGDRRTRGGQLRAAGPAARLWPRNGGRSDRRRHRPAHRRAVHDLPELAARVRRRGADRARSPSADAAHPGRTPRAAAKDRSGGGRAVGGRPRPRRLRRAALERVGVGGPETRRTRSVRGLRHPVADPRRAVVDLALLRVGVPTRGTRFRALSYGRRS